MTRSRSPHGEMPFLDHLEELRWRILWSAMAIGAGAVVGFVLVHRFGALELLLRPVRKVLGEDLKLIYLSPADAFFVTLKLGVIVGIILAFPVVVYQLWSFLSPALEKHEKRAIIPALYMGLVLFCVGVAMAYFWVLPLSLVFFQQFQSESLLAQYEVNETLGFVTKLLLGFGAAFELPVVIMLLSAMGLVSPRFLREKRRHAIVVITILASFLTPGDLTSTFMMMAPLMVLYEGSIFLSAVIYRRREAAAETGTIGLPEPPDGTVEARG
jgi:sec-independent protein translocase protein TatC